MPSFAFVFRGGLGTGPLHDLAGGLTFADGPTRILSGCISNLRDAAAQSLAIPPVPGRADVVRGR